MDSSELLSEDAIRRELDETPGWRREGAAIVKSVTRDDFRAAMEFVNALAEVAEEHNHHPDITIVWNRVTLTLSTHSAGGLTSKDFHLARLLNAL
jgi:4a-hydroxytetrahydrobiopterin dehydratase